MVHVRLKKPTGTDRVHGLRVELAARLVGRAGNKLAVSKFTSSRTLFETIYHGKAQRGLQF